MHFLQNDGDSAGGPVGLVDSVHKFQLKVQCDVGIRQGLWLTPLAERTNRRLKV